MQKRRWGCKSSTVFEKHHKCHCLGNFHSVLRCICLKNIELHIQYSLKNSVSAFPEEWLSLIMQLYYWRSLINTSPNSTSFPWHPKLTPNIFLNISTSWKSFKVSLCAFQTAFHRKGWEMLIVICIHFNPDTSQSGRLNVINIKNTENIKNITFNFSLPSRTLSL